MNMNQILQIVFVIAAIVILIEAWVFITNYWSRQRRKELLEIANLLPIEQGDVFNRFVKKHIKIYRKELIFLLYEISHVMHLSSKKQYQLPQIHHLIFSELHRYRRLSQKEIENIHIVYQDILYTEDVYDLVGLLEENKKIGKKRITRMEIGELKKYYSEAFKIKF